MTEGEYQSYYDPPEEAYRTVVPFCFRCMGESYRTVLRYERNGNLSCPSCGSNYSKLYWETRYRKMAVPAEHFEGNYAIIRPDSSSGHSPSRRFKTQREATAAAVKLAEANFTLTFEVVKLVARVSCLPKATVTRVR